MRLSRVPGPSSSAQREPGDLVPDSRIEGHHERVGIRRSDLPTSRVARDGCAGGHLGVVELEVGSRQRPAAVRGRRIRDLGRADGAHGEGGLEPRRAWPGIGRNRRDHEVLVSCCGWIVVGVGGKHVSSRVRCDKRYGDAPAVADVSGEAKGNRVRARGPRRWRWWRWWRWSRWWRRWRWWRRRAEHVLTTRANDVEAIGNNRVAPRSTYRRIA